MVSFLSYRTGAVLARCLPPHISESMTGAIARSQYYLRVGSRRTVLNNLRAVMGREAGEKEIHAAAKNLFSNFGKSIYCFFRLPSTSLEELRARCDYGGIDMVVEGLRRNGGFIIAGPHVGPWEVGGACLSALGVRIHTVALDHPSARVTGFFEERRRMAGIVSYPIGRSFSPLCDALEQGACVALLIDRTYGRSPQSFPMFGRSILLPTGHAALAVRCRVPILTAVCVFAPRSTFKFVFNGPYYPDTSLDEKAAVEDLHRRCRTDMEQFIRTHVDQWFNFQSLEGENECPDISTP